jgi:hypothetical protein
MAKIAFYADNLTERGTAIALYDYARLSRDLLKRFGETLNRGLPKSAAM